MPSGPASSHMRSSCAWSRTLACGATTRLVSAHYRTGASRLPAGGNTQRSHHAVYRTRPGRQLVVFFQRLHVLTKSGLTDLADGGTKGGVASLTCWRAQRSSRTRLRFTDSAARGAHVCRRQRAWRGSRPLVGTPTPSTWALSLRSLDTDGASLSDSDMGGAHVGCSCHGEGAACVFGQHKSAATPRGTRALSDVTPAGLRAGALKSMYSSCYSLAQHISHRASTHALEAVCPQPNNASCAIGRHTPRRRQQGARVSLVPHHGAHQAGRRAVGERHQGV